MAAVNVVPKTALMWTMHGKYTLMFDCFYWYCSFCYCYCCCCLYNVYFV